MPFPGIVAGIEGATLGMRGYYLSIPLVLWLFGPLWLLTGTLLLIAVLYWLDRGIYCTVNT